MSIPQRPLREMVAAFERELILAALHASGGNQKRAALALGVLPTTLLEKLKRLGLYRPRSGRSARSGERAFVREPGFAPSQEAFMTSREEVTTK